MQGISIAWGYLLWMVNMLAGLLIVQHAICNLSRWQYTVRSLALWWNALLLGGGIHVVTAYTIGGKTPIFGEVLINAGIALMGIRGIRRAYWEYADDPNGLWAHAKAEARRILMMAKAYFAKDVK